MTTYTHTRPRFFTPTALDIDFDPAAPAPEKWLSFLKDIWGDDTESIQHLQEWFGYCLLPDTRQHKMELLVGPPRCGKGTIARVQSALVGLGNTAGPTLASLGSNFGLAPLVGKSLAIISDARLSHRTDSAIVTERLLSISGEDALDIDRKYLTPLTVKLPTRIMMLTNELPRLADPSGALISRFLVLRLTKSFLGKEDTTLTDKLLADLSGILLWAIEGWKRLRERGHFLQPKSGQELINGLEELSSPIRAFLAECCVIHQDAEVEVTDLYARWQTWCWSKGRREAGIEQTFGRDLHAAVPTLEVVQRRREKSGDRRGDRYRTYKGLRLAESEQSLGEKCDELDAF